VVCLGPHVSSRYFTNIVSGFNGFIVEMYEKGLIDEDEKKELEDSLP